MSAGGPFVIVSGLPGSGKTTIARSLAPLMNLPLFDKDDLLERLFDAKGIGDAAWRRQLSRESDTILQSLVSSSRGAVIASFWHVAGMPADSGTPTGWLSTLSGAIVNVHCECPPHVAAERFRQRRRHPGHLDGTRTVAELLESIQALVPHCVLGIGELVLVDTTTPVAPAAILEGVQSAVRRAGTRW